MYNPEQYNQDMDNSLMVAHLTSKVGFGLMDYIRENSSICRTTKYKDISQLMLQMSLVKLGSAIKLVEQPIHLMASSVEVPYVDPMSLVSIERAIYELLAMHHFLFIENKTNEQKDFATKVWEVSGLSNRSNIVLPGNIQARYQSKHDDELAAIESLKDEIHNSRFYKETNDKGRRKIDDSCKKLKPLFISESEGKIEIHSVTFADACKYLYPQNSDNSVDKFAYKMMSFQSHPSYLGILQFGQQDNAPTCYWSATIKGAAHYCAKMIKEIVMVIPEISMILERLNVAHYNIIDILGDDAIQEVHIDINNEQLDTPS